MRTTTALVGILVSGPAPLTAGGKDLGQDRPLPGWVTQCEDRFRQAQQTLSSKYNWMLKAVVEHSTEGKWWMVELIVRSTDESRGSAYMKFSSDGYHAGVDSQPWNDDLPGHPDVLSLSRFYNSGVGRITLSLDRFPPSDFLSSFTNALNACAELSKKTGH
jgi:hypothetical protein